ncbi:uncharacterized protein EKO05_0007062 [Ascochyta rabiei]|uniref:uncharacterized protein n=1 Tax=Didymella rabiei TaxID=5454 RepID=UPI002201D7C2|nr:uncharacterized protein EKO05_0007062 [Ascochyta rabiei]UPX16673.1 hypothetical protein EKO05_0007062 [Ascochyta rabiei]
MEEHLLLGGSPIILANVFLQAIYRELALSFAQPLGHSRKVGGDEESRKTNNDCDYAFKDENTPPRAQTVYPIHIASDSGCDETTEGT